MTAATWNAVDTYIADSLIPPDAALDAALVEAERAGLPAIGVSPPLGKLLHLMARAVRAKRILEIGTLAGYSGIWLARALPADGRLVSLELNEQYAEIARANLNRAGVGGVADVRTGPALQTLARMQLAGEEPFDLIFIDADKVSYPGYLEHSVRLSHAGTVILADNVVREGAVADSGSTDAAVLAVRRFNELVAENPRLSATAIQTVGVKGYDGFAMIVVG